MATEVDVEDGVDGTNALNKVESIKLEWDKDDVRFWFNELESKFELIQIKSQWTKRHVLANLLPPLQKKEVKDLLMKSKAAAGTNIYKQLKTRLLEHFGPRVEDAFEEAAALVLVGKPSALAQRIITLLCKSAKPLENCCCEGTVMALWKRQLPPAVRAAIAGKSMAGEDNLRAVLKHADDVFAATNAPVGHVSAIRADLDTSADQPALQSAAAVYKPPAKKGNKPPQKNKPEKRSPDNPPENSCYLHWRYGRSAYSCKRPGSCPWKDFTVPKPSA